MWIRVSISSVSLQPWRSAMRRWMRSSGSRPVAASETTHTRVRVLRSSPGRVQSAPKTFSVATSMNVRMTGSLYVVAFTRSTYLSPSSWRRISLPFRWSSLSAMFVSCLDRVRDRTLPSLFSSTSRAGSARAPVSGGGSEGGGAPSEILAPSAGTEEPALRPAVGVVVVGDVAHVVVDVALADLLGRYLAQARVHVGEVLGGRLGAVVAPDHHGHRADLTLGDPADVVFVEPRGDARGATEIAAGDLGEGGFHGAERPAATLPPERPHHVHRHASVVVAHEPADAEDVQHPPRGEPAQGDPEQDLEPALAQIEVVPAEGQERERDRGRLRLGPVAPQEGALLIRGEIRELLAHGAGQGRGDPRGNHDRPIVARLGPAPLRGTIGGRRGRLAKHRRFLSRLCPHGARST